jgi:hypothetical protein
MLRFRVKNIVPPGGRYFYEVPESKALLEDFSMTGLLARIRGHYADNGLVVPSDIEARVEDHVCRHVPEGFCYGDLDGRPRARVVTLDQIRSKTTALAAGRPRAHPGLARQRAEICGKCSQNDRSACPTCVGLVSWAQRLGGNDLGGIANWLGICAVDLTAIPAKVQLKDVPDDPGYPETCWRRTSP